MHVFPAKGYKNRYVTVFRANDNMEAEVFFSVVITHPAWAPSL